MFSDPQVKPISTLGLPQAGAYLLFFLTGTTTPANVYADGLLTTPLSQVPGTTQPSCTADSAGRFNPIYLNPSTIYRVQMFNFLNVKFEDVDPYVPPGISNQGTIGQILFPQTAAEIAVSVTPTFYFYPPGDARRYGVVGDGTTDDTTAMRNTILPAQKVLIKGISGTTPLIKDALTYVNKGQLIQGEGRDFTKVVVNSAFNLTALGAMIISTLEPAPILRDFQIAFTQPDTATRASLIAYPPGIYGSAQPRLTMQDFKITNAMTGVQLIGNSGGMIADVVEMSAYNKGFDIDGALDTMRIDNFHFFPFSMTTNQQVIFNDANVTAINSGRCDDLAINAALLIGTLGKSINLYSSASGTTFGTCVNSDFDNYGGINIFTTGSFTFAGCNLSSGTVAQSLVTVTGGFVKMSACEYEQASSSASAVPQVSVSGSVAGEGASLVISGSTFRISGDQVAAKCSASSGTNELSICDCTFFLPQSTSPANPVVWAAAGGRLTFIGNRAPDKGTGTGALTQCDVDERHVITSNAYLGWNAIFPNTANNYTFYGNNSVANNGTNVFPANRGTGAFSSATTVTISHGVNAFGARIPSAGEITITPTSSPAGLTWYVSAITATSFTLTASTSTSMSFGWSVGNPTLQ